MVTRFPVIGNDPGKASQLLLISNICGWNICLMKPHEIILKFSKWISKHYLYSPGDWRGHNHAELSRVYLYSRTQRLFGRIQRLQGFNISQAVNGSGASLPSLAVTSAHPFLMYKGNDRQALLRPQPDLPSAYAPTSYCALSVAFLFSSPASLSAGLCFPGDSSVVLPSAAPAPAVSVSAAPVPSQLSPSWPAPLPQEGFREG